MNSFLVTNLSVSALLVLAAAPSLAAASNVSNAPKPPATAQNVAATETFDPYQPKPGRRLIGLAEFYQLFLAHSPQVRQLLEAEQTAQFNFERFEAGQRPTVSFTASDSDVHSASTTNAPVDPTQPTGPTTDETSTGHVRMLGAGLSAAGKAPGNITYSLATIPGVTRTDTYRPVNAVGPSYGVTYSAQITVPLLKGSYLLDGNSERGDAQRQLRLANATSRQSLLHALVEAQRAFFDLVRQDYQLSVSQRAARDAAKLFEDAKLKKSVGDLDRISTLQAELQKTQAEMASEKAESDFIGARESLREKLGLSTAEFSGIYPDVGAFRTVPAQTPLNVKVLTAEAKKNRVELRAARLNLELAESSLRVLRHRTLPSLDAGAGSSWHGSDPKVTEASRRALPPRNGSSTLSLTLNYTLYGGTDAIDRRAAESSLIQAKAAVEEATKQIERDVRTLVEQLDVAYRRLGVSARSLAIAQLKAEAQETKYSVGEIPIKDLIDGQKEVTAALIDELAVKLDIVGLKASLNAAVGRPPEGAKL